MIHTTQTTTGQPLTVNCASVMDAPRYRYGVRVDTVAAHDLGADVTLYDYRAEAEGMGFDPWRLLDGLDPHTSGANFDLWGAGIDWSKRVGPGYLVYVNEADARRLGVLS